MNHHITYGSRVNALRVRMLLDHALDTMLRQPAERPTPLCIWGTHGIGKTELVRELAEEKGYGFAYIAPAQFEEMGDLVGMPKIVQGKEQTEVTRFVAPEWAPRHEGPGILLIDDVNRADDRILRGIMQLLQYYELVSWSLPSKWLIVLTANPDGGDYSVTSMDDAMLTRMLHVTMEFDVNAWARWAEKAGVDPRGIHFVLAYPELVSGRRTTPRSLVQFFQAIHPIEVLEDNLALIKMLGDATLDDETTQAFISFIHLQLDRLPSPEDLLYSEQPDIVIQRLHKLVHTAGVKRMDILSVVVTRLNHYLLSGKQTLTNEAFENLKQFILTDWLPNDLRLSMAQELAASKRADLLRLYSIPEIGALLVQKM